MDSIIKEYLTHIDLGEVKEYKNMSVVPLVAPESNLEFLTLKEALNDNSLTITEVDESGSVPQLKVINHSPSAILLLDGEELVGAKQNRVLNSSILLKENSETVIPVSCTEQGRWSYKSTEFADSKHMASSRVRRAKSQSVLENLRHGGNYHSNQNQVWDEIHNTSHDAQMQSPTMAMRDIYLSRDEEMGEYVQEFPFTEKQNGSLIFINGEVRGMEILSSPGSYQHYHHKIMKSYALDAVLEKETNHDNPENAPEFLEEILKSNQAQHPSVGYGTDYRFENKISVGSSLVHDRAVVHTVFFRKPDMVNEIEVPLSASSHRAQNYLRGL